MSVIAQPDGVDLSVSELPFNWDARRDNRSLRVGYFQDAFADTDRMPEWMANDKRTLDQLRDMGIKLIPPGLFALGPKIAPGLATSNVFAVIMFGLLAFSLYHFARKKLD